MREEVNPLYRVLESSPPDAVSCEKCCAAIPLHLQRHHTSLKAGTRYPSGRVGVALAPRPAPTKTVFLRKTCPKCGHVQRIEVKV